jgi:protein-S-isoprenylcysteine O-methyltransferase Ste14
MGPPLRLLCNAPDTVERSTSVRRRPWSSSRCAPHRTRRASATPQQHGPSGRALPIRQRSVALEEVSALGDSIVQLWATLMAAVHGVVWVLASRWERPGRRAQLRVRISPPPPLRWGGDVAQITPLMYPVLVVVAPGWGYDGWLNWSSRVDLPVQAAGVGIWAVGTSVVVWAAWTLGPHLAVNGLTGDHELIVHGPYRHVRHPVYGASIAIAVGTALVFRSYLLVAVTVTWVTATRWWAAAEEELLASPEGFGDAYRRYADRTGRFLPRLRRAR